MSSKAREVLRRTWKAPLGMMWELWTTKEGLEAWFGPRGSHATVERIELRPGGSFDYRMEAPNGRGWPCHAEIVEVVHEQRLVYDLMMPMGERVVAMRHTLELVEDEEGVNVTLTLDAESPDMLGGAARGYHSALDRLDEQLRG